MSLLFMSGAEFGTIKEGGGLAAVCTSYGTFEASTAQKRTGTYSWYADLANIIDYRVDLLSAKSELYIQICLAVNVPADNKFLQWTKGTTVLGCLTVDSSGYIKAWTGDKSSLVGTGTTPITLAYSFNNVIECRIKIADSGVLQVKLNNSLEIDYSGDTKPGADADIDRVYAGNPCASVNWSYFDDFIIFDTSGSLNNSWIGGQKVGVCRPNGAGTSTQWDPSAGSNYQCVDEIPPSATDYVYTNTVDEIDTYAMANSPAGATTINGVMCNFWAYKEGAPTPTKLQRVIRMGGTNYVSSSMDLPTSLGIPVAEILEVRPSDSGSWTTTDIDDLELGMKAVSS